MTPPNATRAPGNRRTALKTKALLIAEVEADEFALGHVIEALAGEELSQQQAHSAESQAGHEREGDDDAA